MSLLKISGFHGSGSVTTEVYYAGPEKDLALLLRNEGRYRLVKLLAVFGVSGYVATLALIAKAYVGDLISLPMTVVLILLLSITITTLVIYFNFFTKEQLKGKPKDEYSESQYRRLIDRLSQSSRVVLKSNAYHVKNKFHARVLPLNKRWHVSFSRHAEIYLKTISWDAIYDALDSEVVRCKTAGYNIDRNVVFEAFTTMLVYSKSNDELKGIMDDLILHIIETGMNEEEIVVDAKVAMRKAMPLIYGHVERNRFEYRAILNNREIDQYIANSDEEVRKASEATEKESRRKAYRMRNEWP